MTKWERMWGCRDSQEVGLEAAILERVRNSSLVKRSCAEDIPGLKSSTEATGLRVGICVSSRRAFHQRRSDTGRSRGADGSENVGTSSENCVRTTVPGSLRFPTEGQSASG